MIPKIANIQDTEWVRQDLDLKTIHRADLDRIRAIVKADRNINKRLRALEREGFLLHSMSGGGRVLDVFKADRELRVQISGSGGKYRYAWFVIIDQAYAETIDYDEQYIACNGLKLTAIQIAIVHQINAVIEASRTISECINGLGKLFYEVTTTDEIYHPRTGRIFRGNNGKHYMYLSSERFRSGNIPSKTVTWCVQIP